MPESKAQASASGHVTVLRDQSQGCRWIEIFRPDSGESETSRAEIREAIKQDVQPFTMTYSWLEFYDLRTRVEHLIELVDTYRDTVTNVFGAYQSSVSNSLAEISNRMNQVMQRLTIITAILATASVITGFYGMNLHGLGIAGNFPYGAFTMLAALVAAGLLEYGFFKWMKWR